MLVRMLVHGYGTRGFAVAVLLAIMMLGATAEAASPDHAVPNGHFFTQANGQGGAGGLGFEVSNAGGIPFWNAFQRLGGVDALGYPVSDRFEWQGTVVQAFQKAVLQWLPSEQRVTFVNVFDELGAAGKDEWLRQARATPGQVWLPDESNLAWSEIVRGRQAFLDPFPALKARYFSVPDPLDRYGLASSKVEDMGAAYVVRLQRAVMQQWKIDTPWARAGEVTIANGGDVAKEAGIFPAAAMAPRQASNGSSFAPLDIPRARGRVVVALDPGHGGREIGSQYRFPDGFVLFEKDVNLRVALKTAELLRGAGYEVVLTRTGDAPVNGAGRDLNRSGSVSIADDLQARVDIANAAGAAVLVSIHNNGLTNPSVRGTEVYYAPGRSFTAESRRLAGYLQGSLLQALRRSGYQSVDRGVKADSSILRGGHFFLLGPTNRYVARPSAMPGALGEGLFVTNPSDAAFLRRPEGIDALAQGYAAGIAQYLAGRQ